MSRLPARWQPLWPLFKRAHRLLTLIVGWLARWTVGRFDAERGVPLGAYRSSAEAALAENGVSLVSTGASEVRRVPAAVGTPGGHWTFGTRPEIAFAAPFTLDLRDGTVSGDFAAVITPGRMLDFETSSYFGVTDWREHPVFFGGRLPRVTPVDGTLVSLATRGSSTNYYHFLFDALPRWGTLRATHPDVRPDAILVPHATRYQKQYLELLGLGAPLLQPGDDAAFRASRLLVPSNPNDHLGAPASVVEWIRASFPPRGRGAARRVYVTRGDQPMTRRFVREPELLAGLAERGFACVDAGRLSVQEQIDLFAGAEFVVSPHGAALTNIVHCREAVTVLELFANDYVHLGLWNITHSLPNINYRYFVAPGGHAPGRPMLGVLDDVDIDPAEVLAVIDRELEARG